MIKKSTSWAVLVYGAVIMSLGYLGYHQSQSKASLIAGAVSGFVLLISSWGMFKQCRYSLFVSLFTTLSLTAIFCYRYAATQGTLPAILSVISGAMLIFLLTQMGHWKK